MTKTGGRKKFNLSLLKWQRRGKKGMSKEPDENNRGGGKKAKQKAQQ